MIADWIEFWAKYLSLFLLTTFFTFLGVVGRYFRILQKSEERFNPKAFITEFLISLSLTFLLALACISAHVDILLTCILVGVSSHFGTNGILAFICKYLKIDCSDFLQKEDKDKGNV